LPQVYGSNSVGHFSIGTTSVGGSGCYPAVGRFFRFLPLLGGLLYPVETPVLVNEQADGWVVLSVICECADSYSYSEDIVRLDRSAISNTEAQHEISTSAGGTRDFLSHVSCPPTFSVSLVQGFDNLQIVPLT
jgi:hypothetical protein